jgi:hypothetical protein
MLCRAQNIDFKMAEAAILSLVLEITCNGTVQPSSQACNQRLFLEISVTNMKSNRLTTKMQELYRFAYSRAHEDVCGLMARYLQRQYGQQHRVMSPEDVFTQALIVLTAGFLARAGGGACRLLSAEIVQRVFDLFDENNRIPTQTLLSNPLELHQGDAIIS